VITMQQWRQVQALSEEGLTDAAIARRLGLDRETVAKWRGSGAPGPIARDRGSKLDDYREYLAGRLEEFPELTATVLFREVRAKGYEGGYERVKIFCRERRGERPVEGTARFETGPGEQAQADWLESSHYVEHEGRRRRLCAFIYVLGFSRWSYLEFTVSESQAQLFAAMERAFREAGGVPAAIVVDNLRAAVLRHGPDEIVFNPAFLAFAEHWGFEPIAAAQGRGQTKGKVEAGVKYVKRNCLAGQRPPTLSDAQRHGRWWRETVCNVREHGTVHERPVDRLERERPFLRSLTDSPFSYRPQLQRRVYLDFTVRWQDNFYEVPMRYAGKLVHCQEVGEQLSVVAGKEEIARHDLLEGVGRTAHLPDHKEGFYRPSYPSHLPYQREAFLRQFPEFERFLEGCVKRLRGNAAYHLHKIRELVTEWGKPTVEAALEQATLMGAYNVRAVRQACRRLATLPPPQPVPVAPPAPVSHLPQVEQRSLDVYVDHVR
jgi:transposase